MLFVWGTKRVEKKQGLVADFCPICRGLSAFQLIRVGLASHVYYLSFGEGRLAGYMIRCTNCGVSLSTQPTRYQTVDKSSEPQLETLIRDTFPRLREVYAERLELEARIKRSRSALTGEQHKQFLMEPFGLLNSLVEARFGRSTEMDKPAGIGCLATTVLVIALIVVSFRFNGPAQDKILIAILAVGVIGMIYTFIQMHLAPGRFFRSKIMPQLITALRPLEPTRDDLAACIERCKTLGMKIGKIAKADVIGEQLERRIAGYDYPRT
jgi:Zn-finger nucleic acid-binding protein